MLAALALVIVSMLPSLFLHIIGAAIGAFGLNGAGSRRVPPARQLTPLLLALAANALVFYALRRLIRTFERKA